MADALSRTPEFECQAIEIHSAAPLRQEELEEAARKDVDSPKPQPVGKVQWEKKGGLWKINLNGRECVWVPNDAALRVKLISEHHETPLAGHFGIKKTYARVQEHFR